MIDYISGQIAELTPTRVVIDNQGIGYSMEISLQTYAQERKEQNSTSITTFRTILMWNCITDSLTGMNALCFRPSSECQEWE